MIPFFRKTSFLTEDRNIGKLDFNDLDNRECVSRFFINNFGVRNFFTTKSCTQSLELALMLLNKSSKREVILPSFGFVSLANAVSINGLKCVFVDCDPGTMNINIESVYKAITKDTLAIITINYAGVACDYDMLLNVCNANDIILIEDNAHGIRSKYKNKFLGTFGDISTISFDFLKNISCDEGGGISINNERLLYQFYRSYHFGTNKQDLIDGNSTSYEWKSIGTNAILAEPLAALLLMQLNKSEEIIYEYLVKWNVYYNELKSLENEGKISLPVVPSYAEHNGHMFWIKTKDYAERSELIQYLKSKRIGSAFHYTPLHSSEFGRKIGEFRGEDRHTTIESSRLLRLPLYFQLKLEEQAKVIESIFSFYKD